MESEGCRAVALAKADIFELGEVLLRATARHARDQEMTFTYVYILQSERYPRRFYTGCAQDLRDRLNRHNIGRIVHTAKWKPWRIKTYIALSDKKRARDLES